jgi:branched-chain amino acid transport system permease protein
VLIVTVYLVPQGFMSAWWFVKAWWARRRAEQAAVAVGETAAGETAAPTKVEAGAESDAAVDSTAAFRAALPAGPPSADGPLLAATGLKRRMGGVQAVDGVDLAVRPGQVHALIGPNGSGKTTTLNLLSGYVEPDEGAFTLLGKPVRALSHRRARTGLGRTFQTPLLFEGMTCLENVLVALDQHRSVSALSYLLRLPAARREEKAAYERAQEILAAVGLRDPDRRADVLPPGERRLLEMARLVAARPTVVLLDEPAAGLTHAEIEHLEAMVRAMAAAGLAVVIVEHHVDLVLRLADVVTVLDFGRVIAHGDPDTVRTDPRVVAAYLGTTAQAEGSEGGHA